MDKITKSVHEIYDNRERYMIIGLTGRTGSGCSTAASILERPISELKLAKPKSVLNNANEGRKYLIIKRFTKSNWSPFVWLKIKDIITSFILEVDKEEFADYIANHIESEKGVDSSNIKSDFLISCGVEYYSMRKIRLELKNKIENEEERHEKSRQFYFVDLPKFSEKMKSFFDSLPHKYYTKVYQKIGDNMRLSGSAISTEFSAENIFAISKRVNRLLKIFTSQSKSKGTKTYVFIDTLRNPYEALYFRERYSAFYLMAINTDDETRPSSVERCMQIAHTAKLNSGCLSRQVGACITNDAFSVKAIGWNTPPEGQAPCSLRNVYDLLSHKDDAAFSKYENNDQTFRSRIQEIYNSDISLKNIDDLKGRNVSYCFKDIKNEIDHNKNQVHTRALHAEENAFLQIVKYGGQAIIGGKLFTTSSPCELCAKKAYQLGIKEIYYIDPYPGISADHILSVGVNVPYLIMFSGAIGRAYHQLYEPIIPPKDEISFILKFEIRDYYKELERENKDLKQKVQKLQEELKKSEQQL